jgi:activator of 2-hydroxyglutaryl-CoA dehydratase
MVSKVTFAGGVDVGASRTKVAILDSNKNLIGHAVKKSGTDFASTADACLAESLRMAGIKKGDIEKTIATGYGRNNVSFAKDTKTEIGCHARGCFLSFPFSTTIIDIGGVCGRHRCLPGRNGHAPGCHSG